MTDGAADERAALPPAEGTLLWSIRAWVLARVRPENLDVEARIEAAMEGLDAAEAGEGLCRFMDEVERGGARPIIVERMCARSLTPDERALIGIFAHVGAGRATEAARTLRGMVHPAVVGPALDRALDVAQALAAAEHSLTGAGFSAGLPAVPVVEAVH